MSSKRARLETIYRDSVDRVHGLVLDRCGSRSVAEEITAQTFEAAARHVSDGRAEEVTLPWLFTVAKRRLVDHWRSESAATRARERVRLDAAIQSSGSSSSEDPGVSAALDTLPPRQRLALTLRYLDDWSVAEVAEGLGITYQATESLLARARRSFRAALYADEERGDE
jgi:RNA polymerase sigma-70 factor (ECF subfamily)